MNMFKHILVPTDGSDYTRAAIIKGLELAKLMGTDVTALYVVDQTSFINFPMDSTVGKRLLAPGEGRERRCRVCQVRRREARRQGLHLDRRGCTGAQVSLRSHRSMTWWSWALSGRTGFSKLLLGSVAERVIRFAKCPVLVVKPEVEVEP